MRSFESQSDSGKVNLKWWQFRRRILLILMGVCVPIVGMLFLLADTMPPQAVTDDAMEETFWRIHLYMERHRKVPPSLAVLPKREGYANSIIDAWGRELCYTIDDQGVIALSSLGADGKPGGMGLNADVVRRYRTQKPDGSLNIDDPYWIVNAEIKEH